MPVENVRKIQTSKVIILWNIIPAIFSKLRGISLHSLLWNSHLHRNCIENNYPVNWSYLVSGSLALKYGQLGKCKGLPLTPARNSKAVHQAQRK